MSHIFTTCSSCCVRVCLISSKFAFIKVTKNTKQWDKGTSAFSYDWKLGVYDGVDSLSDINSVSSSKQKYSMWVYIDKQIKWWELSWNVHGDVTMYCAK